MPLYHIVVETLESAQYQSLTQRQRDKIAATKLRGTLLELNEKEILEQYVYEKIDGSPLWNYLLTQGLIYCASTFIEFAGRFGVNYLSLDSNNRHIFQSLVESQQYRLLLDIIEHFSSENSNFVNIFIAQHNYQFSKTLLSQFSASRSNAYLSLLNIVLKNTPSQYFALPTLLSVHDKIVAEEKESKRLNEDLRSHEAPKLPAPLDPKIQSRMHLISNFHQSLRQNLQEDCCELKKKYEKAASLLRKMR